MGKVTDELVRELHEKCGLSLEQCRKALKTEGPNVDMTLRALIMEGKVTLKRLNLQKVSKTVIKWAEMEEEFQAAEAAEAAGQSLDDLIDPMAKAVIERFGNMLEHANRKRPARAELKKAPWPAMRFVEFAWDGKVTLASWKGFQQRQGAYGSRSRQKASDGKVQLRVASPGGENEPVEPSAEQAAAFEFLKTHEGDVAAAVLKGIFVNYNKWRKEWDREVTESMPAIKDAKGLKKLIGLGTVHVLNVAKRGQAYVGFEFGCEWDDEHGLGVMTHQDRVVSVGEADVSFLQWVAEEDGGKAL